MQIRTEIVVGLWDPVMLTGIMDCKGGIKLFSPSLVCGSPALFRLVAPEFVLVIEDGIVFVVDEVDCEVVEMASMGKFVEGM